LRFQASKALRVASFLQQSSCQQRILVMNYSQVGGKWGGAVRAQAADSLK